MLGQKSRTRTSSHLRGSPGQPPKQLSSVGSAVGAARPEDRGWCCGCGAEPKPQDHLRTPSVCVQHTSVFLSYSLPHSENLGDGRWRLLRGVMSQKQNPRKSQGERA